MYCAHFRGISVILVGYKVEYIDSRVEELMKKRKLLILIMIGAMVLGTVTGCGKEKAEEVKQEEVSEGKPEEDSKESSNEKLAEDSKEGSNEKSEENSEGTSGENQKESSEGTSGDNSGEDSEKQQNGEDTFLLTKEVYEDEEGDVHIEYPHVENLVNQKITDWYNQKFESDAKWVMNAIDVEEEGFREYINEGFQVTYQSEDMVSILIRGNYYAEGAAHPYSYMSSYNINLKTGESMSITDEYSQEEIVDDIFSGQNYTALVNIENLEEADAEFTEYVKQELAAKDREIMMECLQRCDNEFKIGEDGNLIEGEEAVYMHSIRLKDGTWAMGMEVTHVLGDYVIIRYDKRS